MASKKTRGRIEQISERIIATISSKWFFLASLGLFICGVLWVIFSSIYPMAYDEAYHLGLIKLYSHYWHPFFADQPPNADVYGAVAREPSFLYHFIFGQLFRLIGRVFTTELSQIIVLRCASLAMVSAGILIIRRAVAKYTKYSTTHINLGLSLFMAVPMVSMLAAQINYDNAMFLLWAVTMSLTLKVLYRLRSKIIDASDILQLIIVGVITSVTKYTSLPVLFAVAVYLAWCAWRTLGIRKTISQVINSFKKLSKTVKVGLACALIIVMGLFVQRYGVNVMRYGRPVPDCRQVLTEHQCLQYPPWQRNYVFIYYKDANLDTSIYPFTRHWLKRLYTSLLYVLNGPASQYAVGAPFKIPLVAGRIFLVFGLVIGLVLALFKRQRFKPIDGLFLSMIICFLAILFLQNYTDFVRVGQKIAIQGRYLLPIILPTIFLLISIFSIALGNKRQLKAGLAVVALVIATQGGGITAFIMRTGPSWYRGSNNVVQSNEKLRYVTSQFILEQ